MFSISENFKNDWGRKKSSKTWLGLIGLFFILLASGCAQAYEGTELSGTAPDFRLVDQNDDWVSLSDFLGKVVVLTFMDSVCEDTCPITAAQLREAHRRLDQNEASRVVFLAVNVNIDASETADTWRATKEWRLVELPNWHFLTGDRDALEAVWADYAIAVIPDPQADEILHTPGVFLIDPFGQKRWYVSTAFSDDNKATRDSPLGELLVIHIRELLLPSAN